MQKIYSQGAFMKKLLLTALICGMTLPACGVYAVTVVSCSGATGILQGAKDWTGKEVCFKADTTVCSGAVDVLHGVKDWAGNEACFKADIVTCTGGAGILHGITNWSGSEVCIKGD